jgi:hypothetical protein
MSGVEKREVLVGEVGDSVFGGVSGLRFIECDVESIGGFRLDEDDAGVGGEMIEEDFCDIVWRMFPE